ncbi:MAG: sn-glycerol-3-phosphate ABC transporter ATP-binding protein UgpC [Rhizobiaceae bacterium]|nr:sn-glycerol-3-phosphate ABC transporter ATP-binding protein UgpC [Rhizobiaceae bacterium]
MASVTIRDVEKSYSEHAVMHGVNIDIEDGEFVILVGPSGCGKSTLLRMIAGLEDITGGDILIGDTVVNDIEPKARNIAMVFQNYALYPHMTVRENMAFALTLNRTDKAEIARRVARAAEILSLGAFLDRYPKQLSGGQRQRVAMGRAIVRDPQVFLFDEPLSNLDAKLRVQMRTEIKELHQRLKTTTIYVTHDQIEAMTMADRIVVMNDGRIEQIGTPLQLYDTPANLFVAGFIGSPGMNFIEGEIENGWFLTADGIALPTPPGAAAGKVVYGIRPEHLVPDPAGVPVDVTVVEPTGPETDVFGKLGRQPIVAAMREGPPVAAGEKLRLTARVERVHLFDAATGRRLPTGIPGQAA